MYAKNESLLAAFFAVLLLREKQKNPFVSPTFFAKVISQKRREKPVKKLQRNVFSYPFVAHMPKIRLI